MGLLEKLFRGKKEPESYRVQDEELVEIDTRHEARLSGDFNEMLKNLYKKGIEVDTHFLYLQLINHTYSHRKEPEMRALFMKLATEHVEQFSSIRKELMKNFGLIQDKEGHYLDRSGLSQRFPHVPTFEHLATVYTEDGEYRKAIDVCEKAIAFGLNDWTKSGYQGRIERINKKMKKSSK